MAKRESQGVLSRIISRLTPGGEETATGMLRSDHRRVEKLFQDFESADTRRKASIASRTVEELVVHATLEEEIFYPALAAEMEDDEPVECAVEEHGLMKKLLSDLAGMTATAPHFDAKYKVLKEIVRHHVREEEAQILPAAESSELDLEALGRRMRERKEALTAGSPRSRDSRRTRARRKGAGPSAQPANGAAKARAGREPTKSRRRSTRRTNQRPRGGKPPSPSKTHGSRKST